MTPFTRTIRESKYSAVANYNVQGFWSNSLISVVTTTHDGKKWEEPTINWGSGGRDREEDPTT
jgi:hypothetical protein